MCGNGVPKNADGKALDGASLLSPQHLAFDTTTSVPDSALYIACADAIRRWDLITGALCCVMRAFCTFCAEL